MKTKIIYISGAEVFDIADIRAAFEEVRCALSLGADTVMFGVPVDADDAIAGAGAPSIPNDPVPTTTMPTDSDIAPSLSPITNDDINTNEMDVMAEMVDETISLDDDNNETGDITTQMDNDPVINTTPTPDTPIQSIHDDEPIPAPKPRRGRPRARSIEQTPAQNTTNDDLSDTDAPTPITPAIADDDPVVPILSVLAAHADSPDSPIVDNDMTSVPDTPMTNDIKDDADIMDAAPQITSVSITDIELDTPDGDASLAIADMITDVAPTDDTEKTLEQLLEKMTPLGEDHSDEIPSPFDPIPESSHDIQMDDTPLELDATDATLNQLAAEFAQNADKISDDDSNLSNGRGKIGKLKNILPFKKARREDPGIMGDLFGWAGIAANDDEISIPGFFTTTAAKK